MAINLASKYSEKVAERFNQSSLTNGSFSNDYEFTGVKTLKVYSVNTVPLNDYSRGGTSRYGVPNDLVDTVQELTMGQDKSFTFVIDKGNNSEQYNVKAAAVSLRREVDEVVTPFIDKYRLEVWSHRAGHIEACKAEPTKDSIVDLIMDANSKLDNLYVSASERKIYIKTKYYKLLKQCPDFINVENLAAKAIAKGVVGEVDGAKVIKVPDSYLPDSVYFIIAHKSACLSPMKLQDYKIHKDPPGLSGDLVEGRIIFDAFVLGSKADGIYVAAAANKVTEKPAFTPENDEDFVVGTTRVVLESETVGAVVMYTKDGTDPRYSSTAISYTDGSLGMDTSGWKGSVTIKAYAKAEGMLPSEVSKITYDLA